MQVPLRRGLTFPRKPSVTSRIFDVLHQYVIGAGGEIALSALTELLATCDIAADTARVVVSRLRREGWIETHRTGSRSVVVMTEQIRELMREGEPRILKRTGDRWDGQWRMVIYSVPETQRGVREDIRRLLDWLGFGRLAASTWISPHDRLGAARAAIGEVDGVQLDMLVASGSDLDHDRAMAGRCWDLAALDAEYAGFLDTYASVDDAALARMTGAEVVRLNLDVFYDYRRCSFLDPDLPIRLLPDGWHGTTAHRRFQTLTEALRDRADEHYLDVTLSRRPA